jgi:hypothetical protein
MDFRPFESNICPTMRGVITMTPECSEASHSRSDGSLSNELTLSLATDDRLLAESIIKLDYIQEVDALLRRVLPLKSARVLIIPTVKMTFILFCRPSFQTVPLKTGRDNM